MSVRMDPIDKDLLNGLKANANLVQEQLLTPAGLNPRDAEQSLSYLDGYIEQVRAGQVAEPIRNIPSTIGSYLGEAMIGIYGGGWVLVDGMPVVAFNAEDFENPMVRTQKQLDTGPGASIYSFYAEIPGLYEGRLPGPARHRRDPQ